MIRYHLSLRQTDEKNKPKGHCGTGCESRSLYKVKKFLTKRSQCDNINRLTCEGEQLPEHTAKRKIKKFLTSEKQRDKILKLLLNKNSEEP